MYDESLRVYNKIIKSAPDNVVGLFNKALLLEAMKNYDDAIKLMERICSKFPDLEKSKTKLAELKKAKSAAA